MEPLISFLGFIWVSNLTSIAGWKFVGVYDADPQYFKQLGNVVSILPKDFCPTVLVLLIWFAFRRPPI
jgi:hypothetical protein